MIIPKKIKIGGHLYEIRVVKGHSKEAGFIEKDCGQTDIGKSLIRIDGDQKASQIEETLIHEIFHAINNTLDHPLLHSLAHSFHQVLKDNDMLK